MKWNKNYISLGRDSAEALLSPQSYVGQYIVTAQLKKVLIVLKLA